MCQPLGREEGEREEEKRQRKGFHHSIAFQGTPEERPGDSWITTSPCCTLPMASPCPRGHLPRRQDRER